ncbi:hypothetical protein [Limnospira platensis]|nr:hypothetical protein [Arthrospira platensis]
MSMVQCDRVLSQLSQLATGFILSLLRSFITMVLSLWVETILITRCLGTF